MTQIGEHGNIRMLPPLEGFPFNLRPSRRDRIAYDACCREFGSTKVDGVVSKLHRSTISYEEMHNDLMKYDRRHVKSMSNDDTYRLILQSVRDDLRRSEKLIPLTMGAVPARDDFPGAKSPGLPYKIQGFRTKREVLEAGKLREINIDWQHIGAGKVVHLPDVCLFARAQIARFDTNKIRGTWGYPLSVYLEEGRFFYPLQDFIKSDEHTLPIAYGLEMANGGMTHVNELFHDEKLKKVVSDWKGFDKTIAPWLIRDAFNILSELFDFSRVRDADNKIWNVRPDKSYRRWKKLVDYFVDTPVRTCKGTRYKVLGGVPSGSCFTNIIDTIINIIVTRWLVYNTSGDLPVEEIYLGDDAVFSVRGYACIEDYASLALTYFGMDLSMNKTYICTRPDNVHFLGYFNFYGFPFKNQDFLIASFIHPECSRSTILEACAAALGQMWSCFDPGMATKWYNMIVWMSEQEKYRITDVDIVLHLRTHSYRHKYLQHVGVLAEMVTLPVPIDGQILEVLPRSQPAIRRRKVNKDLKDIWSRV